MQYMSSCQSMVAVVMNIHTALSGVFFAERYTVKLATILNGWWLVDFCRLCIVPADGGCVCCAYAWNQTLRYRDALL